MDDFLEQTLNMSAWSESNVAGKVEVPWEYNSMKLVENNPRLFTTSSMPSGMGCHGGKDCSSSTPENIHFSSPDDSFFPSSQPSMILELGSGGSVGSSRSPGVLAAAMAPFFLSAGTGSGGSEGSGVQSRLGIFNPLSLTLAQGSLDTYPNEARLLRIKLPNDEETRPSNNIGTLTNFGGGQVVRSNDRQRFIPQNYGGHTSSDRRHLHSEASGVMATPTQTPTAATQQRPRVRARRGQATDPHSIAERQRRERIAERLRKLQELVPSCNKTDKAAMLDQILDYLKFLQLQVKVLSMSRFGGAGAGAVVPLVAEVPNNIQSPALSRNEDSEICSTDEGLAVTERQVAKLMEQDMASALQYLQSKGLCVMPLSLATATSGTSGSIIISNSVSSPVINRTL